MHAPAWQENLLRQTARNAWLAPLGASMRGEGADSASACMSCAAGTFANAAQTLCQPCPMGFYNPFPERSAVGNPCLPLIDLGSIVKVTDRFPNLVIPL